MAIAWFDGVDLIVESALSAATGSYGVWDASAFDSGTWGPDDTTWTDISTWLRAITTDRRFSREVQAWDPGRATIRLDNNDRRFSDDNLSGPYVTAGVSGVRPIRPIRVRARYAGITHDLYRGYAMDWAETIAPGMADAEVQVSCEDEMAALAAVDGSAQTPVGAGETFGRRMQRLLDAAGHTGTRDIDVGRTTMQATTLAANSATELKLTADSEGGACWVDADGTVAAAEQYALMEDPRCNTVQATFGDGSGAELPCRDIATSSGGDQVVNVVSFARAGGTAQVAADPTSRALYRDRKFTRTDLITEDDDQVARLAAFHLEQFKAPERRPTLLTLTLRGDTLPRLLPAVLGLRMRDLIEVVMRRPDGSTQTWRCHVAGVAHSITRDVWTATITPWSASVYQLYAASRWDVGAFDSAAFFF